MQAANPAGSSQALDGARDVADAVLYEGYLLYPYRRSAAKNQIRWQFGVLPPRNWVEAPGPVADGVAGSAEWWFQQTECLLEAPPTASVVVRLRFLQPQTRSVERARPDGSYEQVDRLLLGKSVLLTTEEAVPREYDVVADLADLIDGEKRVEIVAPGGEDVQPAESPEARIVRRRRDVRAVVRLSAAPAETPFRLLRLRCTVENVTGPIDPDTPREAALHTALVSTHTLLSTTTGAFVSLLEPPAWAAAAASGCHNLRTFPVLLGSTGRSSLLLSSPILLYDCPQVAPESPGDLHDAAEIDEILSLRTITLTDSEKEEARATDPRSAAILDRADSLPPQVWEKLHGAIRSLQPARTTTDDVPAWWEPGGDADVSPETDSVLVGGGVEVRRGSSVRLRPRARGTDAHDMFLAGRVATVEAVLRDVDGSTHLAVSVADTSADASETDVAGWYGRRFHFSPDEVEPVPTPAAEQS